jgi:hypothetical protein
VFFLHWLPFSCDSRSHYQIKSNLFLKAFLHQLISQSAVQKPSLKLQTASNAGVEAYIDALSLITDTERAETHTERLNNNGLN